MTKKHLTHGGDVAGGPVDGVNPVAMLV